MKLNRDEKIVLYVLLGIDGLVKAGLLSKDLIIEPVTILNKRRAKRSLKGFEPTIDEIMSVLPNILDIEQVDDYIWKSFGGRGLS